MRVLRSQAEPDLIYAVLTEYAVRELIEALRKPRNETAKALRAALKETVK